MEEVSTSPVTEEGLGEEFSSEGLFEYVNATVLSLVQKAVDDGSPKRKRSIRVTTQIKAPNGQQVRFRQAIEVEKVGKKKPQGGGDKANSKGYVDTFKEWMKHQGGRLENFKKVVDPIYGKDGSESGPEKDGVVETKEQLGAHEKDVSQFAEIEIYLEEEPEAAKPRQDSLRSGSVPKERAYSQDEELEEKDEEEYYEEMDENAILDALYSTDSESDNFEFGINDIGGASSQKVLWDDAKGVKLKRLNSEKRSSQRRKKSGDRNSKKRGSSSRNSAKRSSTKRGSKRGSTKRGSAKRGSTKRGEKKAQVVKALMRDANMNHAAATGLKVPSHKGKGVATQGLSPSLQLVAADAGAVNKVEPTKIGAGIKRRVRIKQSENQKKKKKKHKNKNLVRSANRGWHLRPMYIMLYFLIPLLMLSVDSIVPYLELLWYLVTHPDDPLRYEPDESEVPFIIRLIFSKLFASNPDLLNNGVRVGAAVIQLGGFFVLFMAFQRYLSFFNLLRPKPVIRLKTKHKANEFDFLFHFPADDFSDSDED